METPHKNWKKNDIGWGYYLELTAGITIRVNRGMSLGDGFFYDGLNRRSKKSYATHEEAMIVCEKMAERILTAALKLLTEK